MLSIVIPAYNCSEVIKRQLNSILKLSTKEYEIIVVNDGSEDDTEVVVTEYVKRYSNISLYTILNQGPNIARRTGLNCAKGNYVLFLDADDYINASNLERVLEYLYKNKYDVIEFGYTVEKTNGEKICQIYSEKTLYDDSIALNYLKQKEITNYYWNKVIRKELLLEADFLELMAAEDSCVLLQIFLKSKSYKYIPISCCFYVQTANSLCRSKFNLRKLDEVKGDCYKLDLVKNNQIAKDLICAHGMAHTSYLYACCANNKIESKIENLQYLREKYLFFMSNISNWTNVIKFSSHKRIMSIILFGISPRMYSWFVKKFFN